jgi:hypothetical protein
MSKEISLKELFGLLWEAKVFVLIGLAMGLFVTSIFVSLATPAYKGVMIVAPADGYALGDYASTIEHDQIAALPFWRPKTLEGVSPDFYRFIHTLRGPSVAKILMNDETVLTHINAKLSKKINTPEELAVYLSRHVRVDPLGATPLRKITYHHPDQEFSAAMLRKLHLVADQMIRRDRRRQSQSRIEYLDNMLQKTINPDHRKGITNLLMQQEHIQMLANLNEAYAAIMVEPASASPRPTWPNKPLSYLIGAFIGMILGFILWSVLRSRSD